MDRVHDSIALDLVGYHVLGRHGELGTVVEAESAAGADDDVELLVRGGTHERLIFHLPFAQIYEILPGRRTAISEVDVTDFTARLNDDGTVGLYLPKNA
jgi:hypothetical protein